MLRVLPIVLFALGACQTEGEVQDDTAAPVDTTPVGAPMTGHCTYINGFSKADECKEYRGSAWTETTAADDCSAPMIASDPGTFVAGTGCAVDPKLGECVIAGGTADEVALVFPGDDPSMCGGVAMGCGFGDGVFTPAGVCAGTDVPDDGGPSVPFQPFELRCVDPLPGEPAGASDGQVCTWGAVSACTEEGRKFVDYASCDTIRTQRPYVGYAVTSTTAPDDARLSDADWQAELDWVTSQVESCSCTCCHAGSNAPDGASGWDIEQGPIWIDLVDDDGLAMLAGWVDSTAFGAFDPADNNGFDRSTTGLPTSDVARMQRFLVGELARRGLDEADFAETKPFGGILYDQLFYEPAPCTGDVGVAADGTITWTGGGARYLYLLEQGSRSPGVPPNLDVPEGTLWRLDVAPTADPLTSGVSYGAEPAGSAQTVPMMGPAPALMAGTTYYFVALKDIYQPVTRCTFVYGG